MAIYVDDILIASKEIQVVQKTKELFAKKFKVKDMGKLHYFLGVRIHQSDGAFWLEQEKYACQHTHGGQCASCESNRIFDPVRCQVLSVGDRKPIVLSQCDQTRHFTICPQDGSVQCPTNSRTLEVSEAHSSLRAGNEGHWATVHDRTRLVTCCLV